LLTFANGIGERIKELQDIAARNTVESAEKMTRELNEVLQDARADKAHAAAVSAIATKAKILNIGEQQTHNRIDYNTCNSMTEIGCKLLQSVGFAQPDDASVERAVAANHRFVAELEGIKADAERLLIEQR
jgi:4-diphosphocytidyl-2C-methyl-D-erythritol kinase